MGRLKPDHNMQQRSPVCLSRTGSIPVGAVAEINGGRSSTGLELQLLPSSSKNHREINAANWSAKPDQTHSSTQLQLSIGSSSEFSSDKTDHSPMAVEKPKALSQAELVSALREESSEELRQAMAEKAYAEEARKEARRQMETAEREFAEAKRIRQHAQGELQKAHALREQAMKKITSALLDVTCHACKCRFQAPCSINNNNNNNNNNNDLQMSYVSTNPIFTSQDDDDNETRQDHDQDVALVD
ncbi:hypothetical protein V2J09_019372 [Rumex salicifolius]